MTNPDYTAIMMVIDRSGSMTMIRQSAQDGINEFIQGQIGQPGRRTIRIAQFDSVYESVQTSLPPAATAPYVLEPRGNTALLDAMGTAITEFGQELAALPEDQRPGVVILAVMTDGEENASRTYTWDQIKAMVRTQEEVYKWQILYLGANQDAIEVGGRLGVQADRSLTYAASAVGTRSTYDSFSGVVAAASSGNRAAFTDEDRKKAKRS